MDAEIIDLRVLADFASLGVACHLITPQQVIAWADGLIADALIPPPWMIDLSLVDASDEERC